MRDERGDNIRGEGIFTLARGFHAAGAARVLGSIWQVDDRSTAELVGEFFARVAVADSRGGAIPFAAALRDAKRVLRADRTSRWSDPYYWAAFVLSGAD